MNENTISSTPAKTTPWVEYFKAMAERLADNESFDAVCHRRDQAQCDGAGTGSPGGIHRQYHAIPPDVQIRAF